MKNSKTIIWAAVLVAVTAVVGIAVSSYAAAGFKGWGGGRGVNFDSEKIAAMKKNSEALNQALENNDYAAWKELIGDRPGAEKITEENFPKLVEAYNLMQAGKYEEARQIKEELGIGFGPGAKMGGFMKERRLQDKNGDGFCDRLDLEAAEN